MSAKTGSRTHIANRRKTSFQSSTSLNRATGAHGKTCRLRANTRSKRRRRARARGLSAPNRYLVFLLVISICTVWMCVYYVRLKSRIAVQRHDIYTMEAQLHELRDMNDDLYRDIVNSVDMNELRKKAEALGMRVPMSDQIIYYHPSGNGWVKQYN